ncbi:MAG TPA: hypothetical protein VE890_16840 [Thermoguttaceae bacterium]|nr:hypothetical protein [Thermoguttaceae bacterium]
MRRHSGGEFTLAFRFRFYHKKRGSRRTGSSRLGSAGELIFFAFFSLIGCAGFAVAFMALVVPQWRVNHEFVEHRCIVLDKRIGELNDEDGTLYRPEIEIEYHIGDETFRIWTYDIHQAYSSGREAKQAILDQFLIDPKNPIEYVCWYDPAEPGTAVLVRNYMWWVWLVLIVPSTFILIGLGGVIYRVLHWGKSTERRAVMQQRVKQRDPFVAGGAASRKFPNVPDDSDITNSPGTTLRYRLPASASAGWQLFGLLMASIVWNGIVSVFVVLAVRGHAKGEPDWFLTLFMIPFVGIGIFLIVLFIRQLLVATGIGPTLVEISDHPLQPGDSCRLFVSQSGRLSINSLRVCLVCEEQATYRQGTNTRTETREVYRQELACHEGFEVHRGLPFETECELEMPAVAMHSFKSDHNGIGWHVVVEGDVAGWPDYRRAFPLIVYPGSGRNMQ